MFSPSPVGLRPLVGSLFLSWFPVASPSSGALQADANPTGFRRIATFFAQENTPASEQSVAEIVAATADGHLLIYTDSANECMGLVDLEDPTGPRAAGTIALGGEPTSVAVVGEFALVCVNTSPDFVRPSGSLCVIDWQSRAIVRLFELGGQPDSIAVAPSGLQAVIAIENERNEDLGSGRPPQAPPGFLVLVELAGGPADWRTRQVALTGLATRFPTDPEPEYVDVSSDGLAVVTLQENNHLALVDLTTGTIEKHFAAGEVTLQGVDIAEEGLVDQSASLAGLPREPDAVTWVGPGAFATANEGDLDGGTRGFTIWSAEGEVLYDAQASVERIAAGLGHYPEHRSENKGTEPEGVEWGRYGDESLLFVGLERANSVLVYELPSSWEEPESEPTLRQVLPTGAGPEGLLALPERGLFVVACEEDDPGSRVRASIMIYARGEGSYPSLSSSERSADQGPIPWAALSGLAADPADPQVVYAVHRRKGGPLRILTLDRRQSPVRIVREQWVRDSSGRESVIWFDALAVAAAADGVLWVSVLDEQGKPLLLEIRTEGDELHQVRAVPIPGDQGIPAGLTATDEEVYVGWAGDPGAETRLFRYGRSGSSWSSATLEFDGKGISGELVGLTHLDNGLAVLECNGHGGAEAYKRVSLYSVPTVPFEPGIRIAPDRSIDLLKTAAFLGLGGWTPKRLSGIAHVGADRVAIINDNDALQSRSGETRWLEIDLAD